METLLLYKALGGVLYPGAFTNGFSKYAGSNMWRGRLSCYRGSVGPLHT